MRSRKRMLTVLTAAVIAGTAIAATDQPAETARPRPVVVPVPAPLSPEPTMGHLSTDQLGGGPNLGPLRAN